MNREEMQERIIRYVDGDVSESEEREIAAALSSYEAWRRELDLLERIRRLTGKRRAVSPGLWKEIAGQIAAEARQPNVIPGLWGQLEWAGKRLAPLCGAAAVLLIGFFGATPSETASATYEDYLLAQVAAETAEFEDAGASGLQSIVLAESELTADDVLYFTLGE